MAGHDYDGIQELDNKLPKWWLWLFYITIIFSVIYVLRYHVTGWGVLQEEEYLTEMEDARMKYSQRESTSSLDASNVTLLTDEASLTAAALNADLDTTAAAIRYADGDGDQYATPDPHANGNQHTDTDHNALADLDLQRYGDAD